MSNVSIPGSSINIVVQCYSTNSSINFDSVGDYKSCACFKYTINVNNSRLSIDLGTVIVSLILGSIFCIQIESVNKLPAVICHKASSPPGV